MSFRTFLCLVLLVILSSGVISSESVLLVAHASVHSDRVVSRYPMSGASEVSTATQIGIRSNLPLADTSALSFNVVGSRSGIHKGAAHLSLDSRTAIFAPFAPFAKDELVTVTFSGLSGHNATSDLTTIRDSFSFATATQELTLSADELSRFRRELPLDGTPLTTRHANMPLEPALLTTLDVNPTPGTIYLANFGSAPGGPFTFLLKLNEHGTLFWSQESPAQDFEVQKNGEETYFDENYNVFFGLDKSMNIVDTFRAANGYVTDGHDLTVLADGSYILLGVSVSPKDMSAQIQGGSANAKIVGSVIQTFDKAHNLVFEWRGVDHYNILDAQHEILTAPTIDFQHANSVSIDADGNYLLSNRNLSEVTKIEAESGNMLWRLGGVQNQFTFVNDASGFSYQHDARWLPDGDITLFDNGNFHEVPHSRALEYRLDEAHMTATLVWQYQHEPALFSTAMGSVQRFPNGNTFIGWGVDSITATEVKPDGTPIFEMVMTDGNYSYRALKYVKPAEAVGAKQVSTVGSLVAEATADGFNISFSSLKTEPTRVALYDVTGRMVRTIFDGVSQASEDQHLSLQSHGLPNGSYFCVLTNSDGVQTRQLAILH